MLGKNYSGGGLAATRTSLGGGKRGIVALLAILGLMFAYVGLIAPSAFANGSAPDVSVTAGEPQCDISGYGSGVDISGKNNGAKVNAFSIVANNNEQTDGGDLAAGVEFDYPVFFNGASTLHVVVTADGTKVFDRTFNAPTGCNPTLDVKATGCISGETTATIDGTLTDRKAGVVYTAYLLGHNDFQQVDENGTFSFVAQKTGTFKVRVTGDDHSKVEGSATVKGCPPPPPAKCKVATVNRFTYSYDNKGKLVVTPKVNVCDKALVFQLYNVPSTWDGHGFNATASPQPRVNVDTKTVKGTSPKSFKVDLGKLTPFVNSQGKCVAYGQVDLQNAPGQEQVVWPQGSSQPLYFSKIFQVNLPKSACHTKPPVKVVTVPEVTETTPDCLKPTKDITVGVKEGVQMIDTRTGKDISGLTITLAPGQQVTIKGKTDKGYKLDQPYSKTFINDFDVTKCDHLVVPLTPTQSTVDCQHQNLVVTTTTQDGVVWTPTKLELKPGENGTLTASAATGYNFGEDTQTVFNYKNEFNTDSCKTPPPTCKPGQHAENGTCVPTTPVTHKPTSDTPDIVNSDDGKLNNGGMPLGAWLAIFAGLSLMGGTATLAGRKLYSIKIRG